MVLTAYPVLASDNQSMLSSGTQANSTQPINPANSFNTKPQQSQSGLLVHFTRLTTDEKLMVIYEQLIFSQKTVQNLLIIIAILLFILFNKKST